MEFKATPNLQPIVDEFITPGFHAEIQEEVRQAVEVAVGRAMEDIKTRLARRIPRMFAAIAVNLSAMLTIEAINRDIRITLKMPEEKKS